MTTSAPDICAKKRPAATPKFRYACLTLNNFTEAEYAAVLSGIPSHCTYGTVGKEHMDGSGTPHLQCYVEFKNSRHLSGIKKALGSERYHIEPRHGTAEQASEYCKKEDPKPFEFGELSHQGERTDWNAALLAVRTQPVIQAIASQPQLIPMVRALERVRDLSHPAIHRDVSVHFVRGHAGAGKTYWCNQRWPGSYMKPAGPWFDMYEFEETLILDDYDAGDLPRAQLLRVLEGYPLSVPVKGGFRAAYWKRVVITSNYSPADTFGILWDAALQRRINKIYDMSINPPLPIPCPSRAAINAELHSGAVVLHDEPYAAYRADRAQSDGVEAK